MEYGDFYDIAEYGNANWKGNFTPRIALLNGVMQQKFQHLNEQMH